MTFRTPAVLAIIAALGLGAGNPAAAQPVAPPRPSYSPYLSYAPSWGNGFYGYGVGNTWSGRALQFQQAQQQNMLLQQQANLTNQSLANLQNFLAYGINPNLPITGHGSVFNSLGHWYPSARNGGGGGGMVGGYGMSRGGVSSLGMPGGTPGGPRTAGSGVPLGSGGLRR